MNGASYTLLLAVTLSANTVATVLRGVYGKKYSATVSGYHILNIFVSIISAAVPAVISGFSLNCSLFTFLLAAVFGLVTSVQCITYMKAIAIGPISLTTVLVSMSTVITAFSGVFFGELPTTFQYVGIALMVACFVLTVKADKSHRKATFGWLTLSIVSFALSGAIGVIQKIHQTSTHADELYAFLTVAFSVSVLYSLVSLPFTVKKDGDGAFLTTGEQNAVLDGARKYSALSYSFMLGGMIAAIGVCIAFNNVINLFLVGVMPSAVFFPVVNVGGLLLSILASLALFREKLSKKQWLGLAAGVLAIAALAL